MAGLKKITDQAFVIILDRHRLWGPMFIPWFIEKEEGNAYYSPVECLSPYASPEALEELKDHELELIEVINSYSDRYLFRLFSREKTVVEFTDNITEDRFEKHIKPYIERKIYKCFDIISKHSIPVYRKKTGTSNLHEDDLLSIKNIPAKPLFTFIRSEEVTLYKLELVYNNSKILLHKADIEVLSNEPCLIRYNDSIIAIDEIEGSKLIPFLKREEVRIPASHTERYFSEFVRNIVNRFSINAEGFEIIDIEPQKKPIVFLESGIRNIPVLILKFNYEGKDFFFPDELRSYTIFEKNNGFIFKKVRRNTDWEKNCITILNDLGFYSEDNINFTVASKSVDRNEELFSLIELLNQSYNELEQQGFHIKQGSLEKNYNLSGVKLEINYEVVNDWFDLNAVVKLAGQSIPFIKFKKNILDGNREYITDDGFVIILPEEWFTRYKQLFELGNKEDNKLKLHKQHFSILNEIFNEDECKSCPALEKLVIPEEIPDVEIPEGLNTRMRDYQSDGLRWLVFLQSNKLGGCLADDMGLGKTIQTLALIQYNKEKQLLKPQVKMKSTLLIVPASLIYNWRNEIARFTPSLSVLKYTGSQRKKTVSHFSHYDIVLSSYHTIRKDIDEILKHEFHYIVLDESQLIKNPASQLYKAISRLKSEHKLVLTGTPVENSLKDLWTQLNFVNPGLLGSLSYFKKEFARPIEKEESADREERLSRLIKPFILRRTKESVAQDLPPVVENMVYCDMTEGQQKKYEEERSAVRNSILESVEKTGEEKSAIIVLQGLMKLRQISNHPVLADPDYKSDSGKFDNAMHDIEAVISEGHKILIFSSFVRHLDLFANQFNIKSLDYSYLTGSSSNRGKIVEEFQNNKEKSLFLISLKAGGVGLNLTAADYVFILDPWWNPSAELQALNRAHRIGQDKNIFVKRYITTESIEEKIIRLQEKKSRLVKTFISSSNPLKEMNVEDILELIG